MVSHNAQSAPAVPATGDDSMSEAVIDMSVLASFEEVQMDDEPDLIVELIDLYLDDAPRQIAFMQTAIAETDATSLKRTAHGLKGSSANLGILHVTALCEELEHADHSDSFQHAELLLARIGSEYERARQVLLAEKQRRS